MGEAILQNIIEVLQFQVSTMYYDSQSLLLAD